MTIGIEHLRIHRQLPTSWLIGQSLDPVKLMGLV